MLDRHVGGEDGLPIACHHACGARNTFWEWVNTPAAMLLHSVEVMLWRVAIEVLVVEQAFVDWARLGRRSLDVCS